MAGKGEYRVNILHLSDLHEGGEGNSETWRRRRVLGDAWRENLRELTREDGPFDLLCVTGDVAQRGHRHEYDRATGFFEEALEITRVPRDRFFVVPGNHDIDRSVHPEAWKELRDAAFDLDPLALARWVQGGEAPRGTRAEWIDAVLERQAAYRSWLAAPREKRGMNRPELLSAGSPHGRLGFRASIELAGRPFRVHVIGLDSAWLSGNEGDAGNLPLTDSQVMRLATDPEGHALPGLRLALVHHPLFHLADRLQVFPLLADHVDLLLRGHVHEDELDTSATPDRSLVQCGAGCLYEAGRADRYRSACHTLRIVADEAGRPIEIIAHQRAFSPDSGSWHDESSVYASSRQGRVRLAPAAGPSQPPAPGDTELAPPAQAESGLSRLIIPFDAFLADWTREFVGRQFVFDEVRAFLSGPGATSGYFLLRGEPGIGKSAFLSRLIQEWKLTVFHFNIALQSIDTAEHFIGNLCARLVRARKLAPREAPPEFARDGLWLNQVLSEAADTLAPGERLLVALDALDEAQATRSTRANPLFLPASLPEGVFFLVTARSREDLLLQASRVVEWELRSDAAENLDDARLYIAGFSSREGVASWRASRGLSPEAFTERALEKSRGNFMYLHHVLGALARGKLRDLGAGELPLGLRAYYREHWRQMQGAGGALAEDARRVVCVLAAAGEYRTAEALSAWSSVPIDRVRRILAEWSEFLHAVPLPDRALGWRLYHSEFREFLQSEVDPELRTSHAMIGRALVQQIDACGPGES